MPAHLTKPYKNYIFENSGRFAIFWSITLKIRTLTNFDMLFPVVGFIFVFGQALHELSLRQKGLQWFSETFCVPRTQNVSATNVEHVANGSTVGNQTS